MLTLEQIENWGPQPRFQHDCTRCVLIGTTNEHDIYLHSTEPGGETLVRRYGDEGSEYGSMPPQVYRRIQHLDPSVAAALRIYDEWMKAHVLQAQNQGN